MPGTDNSAALVAARRADSVFKRQAVIDALRTMLAEGVPITYSAVARRAKVSAGLVHASGVKDLIASSIAQQRTAGGSAPLAEPNSRSRVSAESLRQDLALARDEIRTLRAQNAELTERVRRDLGAQVHALASTDAMARIRNLEERNQALVVAEVAARKGVQRLQEVADDLREDLESSRAAHARLMRQVNAAH